MGNGTCVSYPAATAHRDEHKKSPAAATACPSGPPSQRPGWQTTPSPATPSGEEPIEAGSHHPESMQSMLVILVPCALEIR